MRITYLCLEKYIGIYNGLGLDKIEIDFSKAKHKICLIAGPNGVGKSTIIKALHVLPDANNCFVPNQNARKSMIIVKDEEVVYRIDINSIYNNGKRTNEAHFYKNGIDLNPNGNVTSYKEIVFTEFDIDANFIAMSLISSEDRGLADKTPSERKKMIASRIESLEVYNEMYKSLNKKANIFKSHLNSITSKLQNLGSRDELEIRLSEIQKSEYAVTTSIDDNKRHLIEAQTQIKLLDSNGTIEEQYNRLTSDFKNEEFKLYSIENKCNGLKIKLNPGEKESVESITEDITKKRTEVAGLQGEKKQLTAMLSEIDSQINSLKNSIRVLESEELQDSTLDTAQKAKEIKERELLELEEEFEANNSLFNINGCNQISIDTIDRLIKICQDMSLAHIDQNISTIDDINITNTIREAMSISENIPSAISSLTLNKNLLDKSINQNTEILNQLSKKEFHLSNYIAEVQEQLKGVRIPKSCSVEKGCTLLDNYRELNSKMDEASKELDIISPKIKYLQEQNKEQQSTLDIVNASIERLKVLSTVVNYLRVCADDFDSILNGISVKSFCDHITSCEAHQIEKELNIIAGWKENLYELSNYQASRIRLLTGIESIEKNIIKYQAIANDIQNINDQIKTKEEEKENYLKAISDINLQVETCEVLINKLEKRLALYRDIEELESKYEEINKRYHDINKQLIEMSNTGNLIQHLLEDINKYQHIVDTAMDRLTEISNEKKNIESQILIWDNFQKEYAEYNEKYNYVNILRKYSSPTQGGIQSLYMSLYMNKTLDLSNQILSMLFNGQYRILDYIINENEFRIPFIGAGMMVDDISSGSTSQKCIMGSIISMVSNSSASPIYNIALLDEVDGGLDQDNRMIFADTILKAADILNIDQLVSISHSIEASINNVDVILLSNNQNYIDQFANSNIIYMYEGGK